MTPLFWLHVWCKDKLTLHLEPTATHPYAILKSQVQAGGLCWSQVVLLKCHCAVGTGVCAYIRVFVCVCECVRVYVRLDISDGDIIAEQGERCAALIQRGRGVFSLTLRALNCGFPDSRRALLPYNIRGDAGLQATSSSPRGSAGAWSSVTGLISRVASALFGRTSRSWKCQRRAEGRARPARPHLSEPWGTYASYQPTCTCTATTMRIHGCVYVWW